MIKISIHYSILIMLALVLAAQVLFIPTATSAVLCLIWLCLLWSKMNQKPLAKIWTFLLTIVALVTIYISHQTFIGIEAGVAVLTTFLFAKSLETKTRRDVIVLFNFALFVIASSFLFSQSFAMAAIVILALFSCFIGLYRLQTTDFISTSQVELKSLQQDFGHVGKFLGLAVPFFVLLFLFFPRLPPLWHIPIPENKATTGISDSMSPGDIAELSQSSRLAFRIIGDMKALPPRHELYWRAMALDEYDGRTWTSHFFNQQINRTDKLTVQNHKTLDYQYLAADPSVMWVMSLEKSIPNEQRYFLGQDWRITPYRLTARHEPIHLKWLGSANPSYQVAGLQQLERFNSRYTQQLDLKSQQLAQELWQKSHANPEQYIALVLNWYKKNHFSYSLNPGLLGQNRIDDFLFSTRQGFCEHYASSFAMLMRYSGIPARIVVGYQGGQLAPDGKSWEVRQLDAHAWTEVLLDGKWQRFDPTAMIAPQRIEGGMQDYMEQDQTVFGGQQSAWAYKQFSMMKNLRVWSDYASYQWQSKVVGYNADAQQQWFKKIGIQSSYMGILLLIVSIAGCVGFYYLWQVRNSYKALSKYERAIHSFSKKLPMQAQKMNHESFRTWLMRLSSNLAEEQQQSFLDAIQIYERSVYGADQQCLENMQQFKSLLKKCSQTLKMREKDLS
ncbi:MAG: transglutaminaseTgpA domain-containing protein [Acinetobacter sp.]|uniref:transglutaminase family protein n=1 Tax=Acinetobacter sp. TaxID=472 RepID=UPI003CFFCC7C